MLNEVKHKLLILSHASQWHAPVTSSRLEKERDCSQSNFILFFIYFINLIN